MQSKTTIRRAEPKDSAYTQQPSNVEAAPPLGEPPPLTPARGLELVDTIMCSLGVDDEAARALIVLLRGLTYERDLWKREDICFTVTHHAFSRTTAFEDALERFAAEEVS